MTIYLSMCYRFCPSERKMSFDSLMETHYRRTFLSLDANNSTLGHGHVSEKRKINKISHLNRFF